MIFLIAILAMKYVLQFTMKKKDSRLEFDTFYLRHGRRFSGTTCKHEKAPDLCHVPVP